MSLRYDHVILVSRYLSIDYNIDVQYQRTTPLKTKAACLWRTRRRVAQDGGHTLKSINISWSMTDRHLARLVVMCVRAHRLL